MENFKFFYKERKLTLVKNNFKNSLFITWLFLSALLFFLQPFEMGLFSFSGKIVLSIYIGSISVWVHLYLYLYFKLRKAPDPFVFAYIEELWITILGIILGGIVLYIYVQLLSFVVPTLQSGNKVIHVGEGSLLYSLWRAFIVGTPVYGFIKIYNYLVATREQSKFPPSSSKDKKIMLSSNNISGETLSIRAESILFIESDRNNLTVYFEDNNELKKSSIRKSLKEVEPDLNYEQSPFIRCHRSFIVNKNQILLLKGNVRMAILLLPYNLHIPVSRSKVDILRQDLRQEQIKD